MNKESAKLVGIIARHELRIVLRGRMMTAYAVILAALTFAVSYFGLAVIQFTGFQGFERTSISLLNLVFYIVPLMAMLTAVQCMSKEGGATGRLFTEPVTRGEIIFGKYIGFTSAIILATLTGFGFSGALIAAKVGSAGLIDFGILVSLTCLLGAVFAAIGLLISLSQKRSQRAHGFVLGAWFLFVVLFDLLIIGVSFLMPEAYAGKTALYGMFLNPVSAARVAALLQIAGKEVFGAAGAHILRASGGSVQTAVAVLTAALLVWVAVPVFASAKIMSKQDI